MYTGKETKSGTTNEQTNGTYQYGNPSPNANPYAYLDHIVKEGETLDELAKKYNVSREEIIKANSGEGGQWEKYDRSKNWLYAGEKIKIPMVSKERYDLESTKQFITNLASKGSKEEVSKEPARRPNTVNQNGLFGQVIAQSELRPGGRANDMVFGANSPFNTREAILRACPACNNELNMTNDELFEDMLYWHEYLAMGEMETNNSAMIERFRQSTGGFYENDILTKNVRAHPSMQRFIKEVQRSFRLANLKNKGSIDGLFMELYDGDGGNPRFNTYGDQLGGLQFAINDMQMYDIELVSYKIDEYGWYKAEIMIIMYDHFGLDELDPVEYKYDVFESWFVLQHNRGFQPFITRVTIPITVSGPLNKSLQINNMKHHETKTFPGN